MNEPAKKATGGFEYAESEVKNQGRTSGLRCDLQADAWPTAPLRFNTNRDEVHIWRVKANDPNVALLAGSLTGPEHAQATCFRFPASRKEFIVARGFIRVVLGRCLGIPPESVRFREGPRGKPELEHQGHVDRLTFNLSHSRGVILAAITVDREVGIDIEFVDSSVRFNEIARTVFSPSEETWLSRLPHDERLLNYFRHWTRKEAFVKALGEGLSDTIRQVEIVPAGEAFLARITGVPVGDHWMVKDLDVGDSFVAALAVAGHNCVFRFWDWSGEPAR